MPFEGLGDKLQSAFKDLRGKGKLSESDIDAALREVRRALLEADVNFKVAKDFIAHVREKAMGEEVFGSLKPDQTVIKIVRDELTELLGGTQSKITLSSTGMTVIMLVGLRRQDDDRRQACADVQEEGTSSDAGSLRRISSGSYQTARSPW